MDNSYIKDIRVIPTALNLKYNNSRALLDLLAQLQTGSIIKGLIVGTTSKGEVIFHSHFGRFIAPNELNLKTGDTITLRLAAEGEKVSGRVIEVNADNNKSQEPYRIVFVKQDTKNNIINNTSIQEIEVKRTPDLPKNMKGKITYLNLSKIKNNTSLYQELSNIKTATLGANNIPVILKVITDGNKEMPSPYRFIANVSQNKEGTQLIRTDFGIIKTENTKMPIGQHLILEIINLNNKVVLNKAENLIADFLFNIDKYWGFLKQLSRVSKLSKMNHYNQQKQQLDGNITTYNIQKMATILQDKKGLGIIRELSKEHIAIKNLFNTNPLAEKQSDDKWFTVIVPFYNKYNEQVVKHKIKINAATKDFMRFVIEVDIDPLNITLDGLIKFKGENKIPTSFDLLVVADSDTKKLLQEKVQNMFLSSQELNGLKGKIDFQTKIVN